MLSCSGMTILHTAAYNNEEDILEFLLSKQAIVDEKDDEGKSYCKFCCKAVKYLTWFDLTKEI